jgi:hypothetical protein
MTLEELKEQLGEVKVNTLIAIVEAASQNDLDKANKLIAKWSHATNFALIGNDPNIFEPIFKGDSFDVTKRIPGSEKIYLQKEVVKSNFDSNALTEEERFNFGIVLLIYHARFVLPQDAEIMKQFAIESQQ